jgi:hypothetical protein
VAASGAEEAAVAAAVSDQAVQEKCTRQLALTANRKPKYLLYHPATDLYIAGNATRNINHRDIRFGEIKYGRR